MTPTSASHTTAARRAAAAPRPLVPGTLGLGVALVAVVGLALSACSGATATNADSGIGGPSSISAAVTDSGAPSQSPAAAVRKVPLGDIVTLPANTFHVSRYVDDAAPEARKPDTPGTHWAAFQMKQCATADSREAGWKVLLADGTLASEPTSWPQELPEAWLPMGEKYPPGFCSEGRVYIAMPDGAQAMAVVLEPGSTVPGQPEVQWVIGRTSAAS